MNTSSVPHPAPTEIAVHLNNFASLSGAARYAFTLKLGFLHPLHFAELNLWKRQSPPGLQ
jgi:hypothetical protein